MENEIKVGEYIRDWNGQIAKITAIKEYKTKPKVIYTDVVIDSHEDRACNESIIDEDTIVNHSENLKDLLELKDCVKVHNLKGDDITFIFQIYDEKTMMDFKLGLDDNEIEILKIYAKEMMESISYKVERKD